MRSIGYTPFNNGYGFTPRGNNFMMQQPMTPSRSRTPFANRSFAGGFVNPLQNSQNGFRLPSRSLYNSQHGLQNSREASPQRPLVMSNIVQPSPITHRMQQQQIPQPQIPQHNFIQTKDFVSSTQPQNQKSKINELYQRAMNRTNETLNRVKEKEARINLVLNRSHHSTTNGGGYSQAKPFTNKVQPASSPIKVKTQMETSNADPNSKKYVKQELKDGYYEGEICNSKREGFGVLKDQKGDIVYTGYWTKDLFDGKGKSYNQNVEIFSMEFFKDFDQLKNGWVWYEGEFKDGMFHGYGTLQLSNGDKFSGYFEGNKTNGSGNYTFANGEMLVGVWSNNMLESTF